MRGQTIWTAARESRARQSWGVEMKERRIRDTDPRMRLDTRGEGRTCLERERMRKQKTERLRREKAERWGSNLRARQTLLNTAAFREICQETVGADKP